MRYIYLLLTPMGDALSIIARNDNECATMLVNAGYCNKEVAIDTIHLGKRYQLANQEKITIASAYLALKNSNVQIAPIG